MPDVERPPGWVPVDQGVGQVPMPITTSVDGANVAPPADPQKLATEIIKQNQPVINRFVKVQRQEIELGGLDVHSSILPLKDMTVYYSYVQGLEKMHYHLTPQAEAAPEVSQPQAPELPGPPAPEEPPEVSKPPEEAPEVPKPEGPPLVPEEEPPPPEEPPKEEKPEEKPEEEEKKEKKEPEFLEVDMPCFLAVEFGDGAG